MLAINEGAGYRPILTVQSIQIIPQFNARPPSTILFGSQLLFLADNPTGYVHFLKSYFNVPTVWSQLRIASEDSEEQIYTIWPKFPVDLILEQPASIIAAGKDPVNGYWVQFPGTISLFTQQDWFNENPDGAISYVPPAMDFW